MRIFKSNYDTDLLLRNGQTLPKGGVIAVSDLHYESLQHSDTFKAWTRLGLIEEVEPAPKQAKEDFVLPEPVRDVVEDEVQEANDVPEARQPRIRKK